MQDEPEEGIEPHLYKLAMAPCDRVLLFDEKGLSISKSAWF